jgi:hypothetical protein
MRRPWTISKHWLLICGALSFGEGLRPQSPGVPAPGEMEGATLAWLASHEEGSPQELRSLLRASRALELQQPALRTEAVDPLDSHRSPALLPWVSASQWDIRPTDAGAEIYSRTAVTSWAAFEASLDLCLSSPPAYVEVAPLPLFYVRPPRETIFAKKLRKLAQAKAFREIRRRAKREWKATYLDHPAMPYRDYESRLYLINNIGKEPRQSDEPNVESMALELKQEFLGKGGQEGEADIPLLAWGPVTVTDTGSLKLDLGALARSEASEEGMADEIELGEESHRPLIATKDCKLHTSFRVDVDPMRPLSGGNTLEALRRYGVDFELDVLSDVLRRELVSFEVELQGSGDGELKGFFNLVLKAR